MPSHLQPQLGPAPLPGGTAASAPRPLNGAGEELSDSDLDTVVGGLERVFLAYQADRARQSLEHGLAPP